MHKGSLHEKRQQSLAVCWKTGLYFYLKKYPLGQQAQVTAPVSSINSYLQWASDKAGSPEQKRQP